ncbi:MAG: protein phosphatase 2C domain-containing protein [Nitrososphaerota archaeon]
MDDLHPDSNDAKTVKIFSDEPEEATTPAAAATEDAPDSAASKEDTESANGNSGQSSSQSDESGNAIDASEAESQTAMSSNGTQSQEASSTAGEAAPTAEAALAAEAPAGESPQAHDIETPESDAQQDSPERADAPAQTVPAYSTIRELGRDDWGRILLAWRDEAPADDSQDPPVVLLERATLDQEAARNIVDVHLYHARLLAPRAVIERESGIYWLVVEAPASYDAPFVAVGDGGRLDTKSTLKAGVGLANALSYLHTNGVAHGHIGPNAVLVHDGRAYLSGLELAALVETTEATSAARFAADVNALGAALVVLAGLPDTPTSEDEAAPIQALREIARRAAEAGYVTAEELAQDCGQALQEPALTLPPADEAAIRQALRFRAATATTVGLLRSQNQDALGSMVLDVRDDVGKDHPLGIFLVADGMGGEAAGEIASRIGARIAMAELIRQLLVPTVALPALEPLSPEHTTGATSVATLAQALAIAVDAANRQVRSLAATLQESTGTTLTAVVIAGSRAVLAHLGDSRAYLLRNGSLIQLTKDHSLLARLQELDHPLLNDPSFGMPRNYLYRSLGQEDEAPPDMMEFPVVPGDRLLLCCDGLWDELDDATLLRSLTSTDDPIECANHLVRMANASGGHDNSSVVVVFVDARPDDPATEFTPEQVTAILRATGALDEEDEEAGDDNTDSTDLVDNSFDIGLN